MYSTQEALEHQALRDLEQRLRATGWVEEAAGMLESFGGLDLCLLRFLRARRMDIGKAAEALRATLAFRQTNEVGSLQAVAAVQRDGISDWWCGIFAGVTSTGCPVTYWRFRCIDTDRLKLVNEAQLKRFYIAWMEHGLALQREVTAYRSAGCPGMVDIYDMEGVRWGQMSSGMRLLSGVLSIAQDHYPENLSQAFLVNVPTFFAGTWRLISTAVDKHTLQKITICKNNGAESLDALLECAQGLGNLGGRDYVWRLGDEWLGGDSDEIVEFSAKTGWAQEQIIVVTSDDVRVGGKSIGHDTWPGAGSRLMWCFCVDSEFHSE